MPHFCYPVHLYYGDEYCREHWDITPENVTKTKNMQVAKQKQVEKQRTVTKQRPETHYKKVTLLDYFLHYP